MLKAGPAVLEAEIAQEMHAAAWLPDERKAEG